MGTVAFLVLKGKENGNTNEGLGNVRIILLIHVYALTKFVWLNRVFTPPPPDMSIRHSLWIYLILICQLNANGAALES